MPATLDLPVSVESRMDMVTKLSVGQSDSLARVRARRPGRPVKSPLSRLAERPPRTFQSDSLEKAFLAYCQLASPAALESSELQARRQELLKASSDYIHLDDFDQPDAEAVICGAEFLEPVADLEEEMQAGLEDMQFAKLCTRRLLGKGEEKSAIKRLHYFKFLAHRLLTAEATTQWSVARAEALVRAAFWHRALVIQSNMRLVVSIVRKLPVSPNSYDELVSDGIVGMLRALDKFDPNRGYRFCTYATTVIRRECFHTIQERREERRKCSQSEALTILTAVRGLAEGAGDRTHWVTWRKRLLALMQQLSSRERVVISSRYCLGADSEVATLQQLADTLKLSKERIRQIEINALAKLKALAVNFQFSHEDNASTEQDLQSQP